MVDRVTLTNANIPSEDMVGKAQHLPDGELFVWSEEAFAKGLDGYEDGFIPASREDLLRGLALMPCGTCNGSGEDYTDITPEGPWDCPACGGLRYDPETVELIAKADYEFATGLDWSPINPSEKRYYMDKAVAVLDALDNSSDGYGAIRHEETP